MFSPLTFFFFLQATNSITFHATLTGKSLKKGYTLQQWYASLKYHTDHLLPVNFSVKRETQ